MIALLLVLLAVPASANLVSYFHEPIVQNIVVSTTEAKLAEQGAKIAGLDLSMLRMYARLESIKTDRSIANEEPAQAAPNFGPEAEVGIDGVLMPMFKAAMDRVDSGSVSVEDMGTVMATYTTLGQTSKSRVFCKRMLNKSDKLDTAGLLWLNKRCRGI